MTRPNASMPGTNITIHETTTARADREELLGQRGCVVWLTGLSGSGKSTIAHAASDALLAERRWVYVLDGDNVRHGLNEDLGFSPADRAENIRRLGEVAGMFADACAVVFVAAISPCRADRDNARNRAGSERFFEVFVETPLEICEERDPKGLYRKARSGELAEFTGVSAPYERPASPDLVVNAATDSVEKSVGKILALLRERGVWTR